MRSQSAGEAGLLVGSPTRGEEGARRTGGGSGRSWRRHMRCLTATGRMPPRWPMLDGLEERLGRREGGAVAAHRAIAYRHNLAEICKGLPHHLRRPAEPAGVTSRRVRGRSQLANDPSSWTRTGGRRERNVRAAAGSGREGAPRMHESGAGGGGAGHPQPRRGANAYPSFSWPITCW